jgi:uncharacterized protein
MLYNRHYTRTIPLAVILLLACLAAPAQVPDLKPTGHVNDYAGVLSPQAKQQIESLAVELQQKTGAQVAVAIVQSLGDEPIENYANTLAQRWGVGDQQDRGALLLLATDDRKLRLEVGYGLEPIIPDGRAGEILDEVTAHLRRGDYDSAVAAGVIRVAQIVAQDAGVTLTGAAAPPLRQQRRRNSPSGWWPLLFILPFLLFPRRGRRGGWRGDAGTTAWMLGSLGGLGRRGGLGGRGFRDGGGFGGGGFGGFGGGGFGGGGASRSW